MVEEGVVQSGIDYSRTLEVGMVRLGESARTNTGKGR
jgi:hypothetical protein